MESSEIEAEDFDIRNERKPFINVLFFGTCTNDTDTENSGPDHLKRIGAPWPKINCLFKFDF